MIQFSCHYCNQPLEAEPALAGKRIDCPACAAFLLIPNPTPLVLAPAVKRSLTKRMLELVRPIGNGLAKFLGISVCVMIALFLLVAFFPFSLLILLLVGAIAAGVRLGMAWFHH
jgi:hypothetical protein